MVSRDPYKPPTVTNHSITVMDKKRPPSGTRIGSAKLHASGPTIRSSNHLRQSGPLASHLIDKTRTLKNVNVTFVNSNKIPHPVTSNNYIAYHNMQ